MAVKARGKPRRAVGSPPRRQGRRRSRCGLGGSATFLCDIEARPPRTQPCRETEPLGRPAVYSGASSEFAPAAAFPSLRSANRFRIRLRPLRSRLRPMAPLIALTRHRRSPRRTQGQAEAEIGRAVRRAVRAAERRPAVRRAGGPPAAIVHATLLAAFWPAYRAGPERKVREPAEGEICGIVES